MGKTKIYACKQCKVWTTRKNARECIKTHIRIDKDKRTYKHPTPNANSPSFVSNITGWMLREELNE